MLYWTDKDTSEKILDITISLGNYTNEHNGGLGIISNYTGKTPTMNSLGEISKAIEEVEIKLNYSDNPRSEYLKRILKGHKALIKRINNEISYKDAVKEILEIDLSIIPDNRIKNLHDKILQQFDDLGYTEGSLAEKMQKWNEDNLVTSKTVIDFAKNYVSILQSITNDKVVKLPNEERIEDIEPVRDVFWSGYSKYIGNYKSKILFNLDNKWVRPTFVDTLSHEMYPGHHTWYSVQQFLLENDLFPYEASCIIAVMSVNVLFEGMAEASSILLGLDNLEEHTLGIDEDLKKNLILARDIIDISRIYQINACYMYNVESKSKEDVIGYMVNSGWIEIESAHRVFDYFSHKINGLYYPSYYYGKWIIKYAYDLFSKDKLSEFYEILLKTPNTVGTFIEAIQNKTNNKFDPIILAKQ